MHSKRASGVVVNKEDGAMEVMVPEGVNDGNDDDGIMSGQVRQLIGDCAVFTR